MYNAAHTPFHNPPANLLQSEPPNPNSKLSLGKAMIEALDTEIGRLLAGVPASVMKNTTVIFVGDNGTHPHAVQAPFLASKSKGTVYNGGIHVPLIIKSPRTPESYRGLESQALVDVTDFMPTVAEIVGVQPPSNTDGISLVPYLDDPSTPSQRGWIYAERFTPNFVPSTGGTIGNVNLTHHYQAVRGDRYKLLRLLGNPENGAPNVSEEFYDVQVDYFETNNLLDSSGLPPAGLQAEYDALAMVLDDQSS